MAVNMFSDIHDPGARVRALCDYGSQVDVDKAIAPRLYLRSGREMIRMANVYLDEGNLESAFILYSKYITLFIEKLPSHPDYKSAPAKDINEVKRKIKGVFPLAEEIKNKLKSRYTEQEKKRQEIERQRQEELAREEEKRKQGEEAKRIEAAALSEKLRLEAEEKWMKEQEDRYHELQEQEQLKIAQKEHDKSQPTNDLSSEGLDSKWAAAPTGPPQFVPNDLGEALPGVPDRDLKKQLTIDNTGPLIPAVDRTTKPQSFDHFTSTGLFGGGGERQVTVPTDLMGKFVAIAQPNTDKKTETLGILFGSLSKDAFHITHLFIPHQHGTPDSCDMEFEEDLIDYQDQNNLITLGWIHTHPTQTAFLSSVDLHTHFPYQKMLPEAIAIVCSPKYKETGIFRLTSERGLNTIGSCREKGFHYHAKEPPLFENCGHVTLLENKAVAVADYRRK